MSPEVTVLMTVYNGEKYLRDSINSILNQTFMDFEFLIIDDASIDSSRDIILSYNDLRIKLIKNNKNVGQAESLNRGLQEAKAEYVARMDQDDVSLPLRLEKQVIFLDEHPEVGVSGTFAMFIDGNGEDLEVKSYEEMMTENENLKTQLLFRSCFIHPSVIFRLSLLKDHHLFYEKNAGHAQDYRLWYRMSSICDFVNIPNELYKYRLHKNQLSKNKRNDQYLSSNDTRRMILKDFLGREVSQKEQNKHSEISIAQHGSSLSKVNEAENWLKFLMNHNKMDRKYKKKSLTRVLQNIWMLLCMNSSHLGMKLLLKYFSSNFWKFSFKNLNREIIFFSKCMIKHKVKLFNYRI
jgi:glycosyltransferase involved in cell wall biosynthesis